MVIHHGDQVISQECHACSTHWQLDNLFNNLFRLTSKKTSKLSITGTSLLGEISGEWFIPLQRDNNAESAYMLSHHHKVQSLILKEGPKAETSQAGVLQN